MGPAGAYGTQLQYGKEKMSRFTVGVAVSRQEHAVETAVGFSVQTDVNGTVVVALTHSCQPIAKAWYKTKRSLRRGRSEVGATERACGGTIPQ